MSVADPSPTIASDHFQPLLRLARKTRRFWWVGLLAFVAVILAGAAYVVLRPKQYRSETVLYYREGMQWMPNEAMGTRRIGQRLKDTLLARAQLAKVIEELRLYPALVGAGRLGEAVEEMRLAITFKVTDGDTFILSYIGPTPAEAQKVTARLAEVLISDNARLRSGQAEVAREFLDAEKKRNEEELATREAALYRFLAKHPEFAREQGAATSLRARGRADGAAADAAALARDEARVRRLDPSQPSTPRTQVDPALLAARSEAEARLRSAQRELADRQSRFTESHPDVRKAVAAEQEAAAAYKKAVDAVTAASGTAGSATPAPRADADPGTGRAPGGPRRVRPPPGSASETTPGDGSSERRVVALETEWAQLNRAVTEARERFQHLDTRQFMASMAASTLTSGQAAQIVVIDPAFLPAQPVGLSRTKAILGVIALALGTGLGLAIVFGLLDDRAFERADVERLVLAPVLVEIGLPPSLARKAANAKTGGALARVEPKTRVDPEALQPLRTLGPGPEGSDATGGSSTQLAHRTPRWTDGNEVFVHRAAPGPATDPRLFMRTDPESLAAASFRVLRHRLLERPAVRTILVTSARPAEGVSTCAVNLALALAENGRAQVLLVEANLRRPALARLLGFAPPVCFRKQLEARGTGEQRPLVVVETDSPWLHVAAVSPDATGRPNLDGPALARVVDDARRAGYTHVVIDGPAVLGSADANAIEEIVDGILFATWIGRSRAGAIRKAVEQVGGAKLLGFAFLGS